MNVCVNGCLPFFCLSGTYRCDVQDNTFRRVKRVYWGVRVLPSGLFNLDYETSLDQWTRDKQQQAVSDQQYHRTSLPLMVLTKY